MAFPDKIRLALAADNKDMVAWSSLLHTFPDFQSELSLPEKLTIYHRCEEFRIFWNSDRQEVIPMTRNSGEVVNQIKYIKGLNIDIADINPNNIYQDPDLLDYFQTDAQNIYQLLIKNPTKDSGRDTDSFGGVPALAI
jgi:hypothetical protein